METNGQQKDLQRIMTMGSCLAGGALAASLQALRPQFNFTFSFYTVIAFAAGFFAFLAYWRLAFAPQQDRRTRRLRTAITVVLVLGGLAGVLYPLRFVDRTKLPDLAIGLLAATLALSGVFYLLYRCRRFLEKDDERNARRPDGEAPRGPDNRPET